MGQILEKSHTLDSNGVPACNTYRERAPKQHRIRFDKYLLLLHKPILSILGSWLKAALSGRYVDDELGILLISLLKERVRSDFSKQNRIDKILVSLESVDGQSYIAATLDKMDCYDGISWKNLGEFASSFERYLQCGVKPIEYIAGVESQFRSVGALPYLDDLLYLVRDASYFEYSSIYRDETECDVSVYLDNIVREGNYDQGLYENGIEDARSFIEKYSQLASLLAYNITNTHYAMHCMIRRKAKVARNYHGSTKDYGFSFDELFSEDLKLSQDALEKLYDSPLINKEVAGKSALILMNENKSSKMFRIFSPDEIDTIQRWIEHYPEFSMGEIVALPKENSCYREMSRAPSSCDTQKSPHINTGIRSVYHRMINLCYPFHTEWQNKASNYIESWVKYSRGRTSGDDSIPEDYPEINGLVKWVTDRHNSSFNSDEEREVPTRAEVVDSTTRQSPLVLLDGIWLLGVFASKRASQYPELLEIADDELGNGKKAWNHPHIYRKVLKKMAVNLPATDSLEFANCDKFSDSDFYLPIFWISMMIAGDRHFAYLLGLNLSIELAGVGSTYKQTSDNLKRYGFPTIFTDLHNSIDNVESGHSFMALKAVERYMNAVCASKRGKAWQDIKDGYFSLFYSPSYFARKKLLKILR